MSKITIGNVEIPDNIFLAPMAGVTDLPFRILCHEQGCAMAYTEMVSAKAIFYGNKGTDALIKTDEREGMLAVQIFGSEPELMADMATIEIPISSQIGIRISRMNSTRKH